jgi:glycosyltransferase involved in cell wall biosynthesis
VDGVNTTVWLVAREQALLGNQVCLIVDTPPDEAASTLAEKVGFELIHLPANTWRYDPSQLKSILQSAPPDLVHLHSVFLPKQATLAKTLVRKKIPYLITPNGGLDSQRGQVKKIFYSFLAEKQRFFNAAAVTVVNPKEENTIRALVPRYRGIIRWIANPVEDKAEGYTWQGNISTRKLVFLGRFDVLHKGIDILMETMRLLPDVEAHLYGTEDPKTKAWFDRLMQNCPANVHFHSPIFGIDKFRVLADASLYIQTSRWEGFPLSIAEAMYMGVPCAVSELPHFAELFRQHDLGPVIPADPQQSAIKLKQVLEQPEQLWQWSKRAQSYAQAHFQPETVALRYLQLYKEIINA